jgi:saccharopine dehydrogenase (NAD+, L-lysine forming)
METLWLRVETELNERRTPVIPVHAGILVRNGYRVCVEASKERMFRDSAYRKQGCILVEKGSWRFANRDTLILGIKELPDGSFPLRHRHFYFAHACEGQGDQPNCSNDSREGAFFFTILNRSRIHQAHSSLPAGPNTWWECVPQRHVWTSGSRDIVSAPGYIAFRISCSCAEPRAYARLLLAAHVPIPRIMVISHRPSGKVCNGATHLLDEVGLGYDRSPKINVPSQSHHHGRNHCAVVRYAHSR